MNIKLAKTAGFCFGVDRAVKLAYDMLDKGERISTYGPIIHNPQVINDLAEKGVTVIERPEEATADRTVIIRAHGVPKDVYECFEKNKIKYVDATCPFVMKIHKIVSEHSTKDNILMIAGDENHPEVIGFRSRAKGRSFVFKNVEELKDIVEKHFLRPEQLIFVAQTTFSLEEWKKAKKILPELLQNYKYYDTICSATQQRQNEAEKLSESCDAMIVIGGRFSSNTVKLQGVCSQHCPTFLVEEIDELKSIDFSSFKTVGITAGASTPASIIKEGVTFMTNENENFEQLLKEYDYDNDPKCKGIVTGVTPTEIQVDIGRKFAGYIPAEEYSWDPTADHTKEVKVGDTIMVKIMKTSEDEGTIMLSKRRYDSDTAFDKIVEACNNGDVVTAVVGEVRNGGVLVYPFGGRVFIPYSMVGLPRGASLNDIYKKEVSFKIISVEPERKRAVGSIKAITDTQKEEALAAFLAEAEVGKEYTGKVTSVVAYGAFVDLGGVEALLHRTEISWKRFGAVTEVLNVGDEINVRIIKIEDTEDGKKRISISAKKEEDLPWPTFVRNCNVGDVVKVKIIDYKTFGAIARLVDHHVRGLIHIREIANHYVENIQNELKLNQICDAKIIAIDTEKHRINLSIKELLEEEEEEANEEAMEYVEAQEEAEAPAEEVAEAVEEAPAEEAPVEEAAAEEAPAEE